jgi:hypothetical protein
LGARKSADSPGQIPKQHVPDLIRDGCRLPRAQSRCLSRDWAALKSVVMTADWGRFCGNCARPDAFPILHQDRRRHAKLRSLRALRHLRHGCDQCAAGSCRTAKDGHCAAVGCERYTASGEDDRCIRAKRILRGAGLALYRKPVPYAVQAVSGLDPRISNASAGAAPWEGSDGETGRGAAARRDDTPVATANGRVTQGPPAVRDRRYELARAVICD